MKTLKDKIHNVAEVLAKIAEIPQEPALGIDIDGTIDEAPFFFRFLSHAWRGPIYAITRRNDYDQAARDVQILGVKVDRIILVSSFAEKAKHIKDLNIKVFFDDMDEVLMHIPEGVVVFKIRNGGNFDYESRQWLYSDETGKKLH